MNIQCCARLSFRLPHAYAVLQDPASPVSASQTSGKPESDDPMSDESTDDNGDQSNTETPQSEDLASDLRPEDLTAAAAATSCAVCAKDMRPEEQGECNGCDHTCHEECVQDCDRYETCAGYIETHEPGEEHSAEVGEEHEPEIPVTEVGCETPVLQPEGNPSTPDSLPEGTITPVVDDSACPIMNGDVTFACIECFWQIIDQQSYQPIDLASLKLAINHTLRSNFHDNDGRPWQQREDKQDLESYRELMRVMRNKYKQAEAEEECKEAELEEEEGPERGSMEWKILHAVEDMVRCKYKPLRIFQSPKTPAWVASDKIQGLLGRENSTSFQNRPHTDHHATSPGSNWSPESIRTYKTWKQHKKTYQEKFWSTDKQQVYGSLSKIPHALMIGFVVDMADTYALSFGQATFTAYSLYRNKVTENNKAKKIAVKERERVNKARIEALEKDASEVIGEQELEATPTAKEQLFAQFQRFLQKTNQGPQAAEQGPKAAEQSGPPKKKRRKKRITPDPEIAPTETGNGSDSNEGEIEKDEDEIGSDHESPPRERKRKQQLFAKDEIISFTYGKVGWIKCGTCQVHTK